MFTKIECCQDRSKPPKLHSIVFDCCMNAYRVPCQLTNKSNEKNEYFDQLFKSLGIGSLTQEMLNLGHCTIHGKKYSDRHKGY